MNIMKRAASMRSCPIFCLLLVFLLVACGGGSSAYDTDNTQDDSSGADGDDGSGSDGGSGGNEGDESFAVDMLAAVNDERAREGLALLTWDDRLAQAAFDHAQDMIDNDFQSHTGSDGSSVGDRVTSAGYQWSWVGENIAWGQTSISQVMDDWMNSDGHRANILHTSFTQIGAARIDNHWVQVFATPSTLTKSDVDWEDAPEADG